jgi:hypothetical protein
MRRSAAHPLSAPVAESRLRNRWIPRDLRVIAKFQDGSTQGAEDVVDFCMRGDAVRLFERALEGRDHGNGK